MNALLKGGHQWVSCALPLHSGKKQAYTKVRGVSAGRRSRIGQSRPGPFSGAHGNCDRRSSSNSSSDHLLHFQCIGLYLPVRLTTALLLHRNSKWTVQACAHGVPLCFAMDANAALPLLKKVARMFGPSVPPIFFQQNCILTHHHGWRARESSPSSLSRSPRLHPKLTALTPEKDLQVSQEKVQGT